MRPERRLLLDVFLLGAGVLLALAAVIALVDGVEQARALAIGQVGWLGWWDAVAARIPEDLARVAPVAAGLAGALAGRRWLATGAATALSALGRSPARLVAGAGAGGLLVAALAGGLREAAAPWAAGRAAADGAWIVAPASDGTLYLRAAHLAGRTAVDVTAVVQSGDGLAVGHAPRLRWDGRGWGAAPAGWQGSVPALPDPATWRRRAVGVGARTSLAGLWAAPSGPARRAWLWVRVALLLGGAFLAASGLGWGLRAPGTAVPGTLGLGLLWSFGAGGAFAVAARGGWSPDGAALAVLGSAALAAVVASVALERGGLGRAAAVDEQVG